MKNGGRGRIIWKLNSLVDPAVISALYEASNEGVEIELIVRGICCLIPGVKNLSEKICVKSIVGRYLEHSRIYYFYNNGEEEILLSSADMMQRNIDRRVEVTFPVQDDKLKAEILRTILKVCLKDNIKARVLNSDMTYKIEVPKNGEKKIISQEWLMKNAVKQKGEFIKTK